MLVQMWSNMSFVILFLALDFFLAPQVAGTWKCSLLPLLGGSSKQAGWVEFISWSYELLEGSHRTERCDDSIGSIIRCKLGWGIWVSREKKFFESATCPSWVHLWPWGSRRACWLWEFCPRFLPIDCSLCLGASSWLLLCYSWCHHAGTFCPQ